MNKPDSPRTRFSRQKLQEFFGMEIEGLLYRVELIAVVQEPGYERSRRKRAKQKRMKHLAVMSDKVTWYSLSLPRGVAAELTLWSPLPLASKRFDASLIILLN